MIHFKLSFADIEIGAHVFDKVILEVLSLISEKFF